MNREPVKSSFLAAIGYDAATQMLEVQFSNGKVYQYFEVPAEVLAELRAAKSLGAAYNKILRGFASRRATELEEPQVPDADNVQMGFRDPEKK